MEKIKILFLIDVLEELGGAEKNLLQVVSSLDRSKFEPMIYCLKAGFAYDEFRKKGVEAIDLNLNRIYGFNGLIKAVKFIRFLRKNKVKIVVTYFESSDFWGALSARLAAVPIVLSNRRDLGFNLKKSHILAYRFINRYFDRIIAVCNAVKDEIVKREKVNPDKIVTIYNGVDTYVPEETNLQELKRSLGLDENKQTVTMVANFDPIKGHKDLLTAAAKVLDRYNSAQFLLVGTGRNGYEQQIKSFAAQLGINKNVVFAGFRPNIAQILMLSDISVLSSSSEGFSNAVIESMAAGKPVIAANVGGNKEAIDDGKTGFLFPPKDTTAFADLILLCLRDRELAQKVGQTAKLEVERLFTAKVMIEELENLFEALLEQKTTPAKNGIARKKIKKFIKLTICNLLYYCGVLKLLEARNSKKSITILAYHKITDTNEGLSLSTSIATFKKQLQYIVRHYKIVSLKQAIGFLRSRALLPGKMAVITFDDGTKDIFLNAFPFLKESKIPATIFLTIDPIEKHKLLWFDFIPIVIKNSRRKTLDLQEFGMGKYLINSREEKELATERIVKSAKKMNKELREKLCESLQNKLSISDEELKGAADEEILTWEEIRQMRDAGIEIGAHTMSHTILTNLPLEEARLEICESKRIIEDKLRERVELFAYPNGSSSDFNDNIIRILKENNFQGACTLMNGNSNDDVFALHRVNIHERTVTDSKGIFRKSLFSALITGVFNLQYREH